MIIAVSDIHLGMEESNRDTFLEFLRRCNGAEIEHLVLLGDIMDFWRRKNAGIAADEKNAEILRTIGTMDVDHVHYIVGNHDYAMLSMAQRYGERYPLDVAKYLRLEDGDRTFSFIHGYELEVLETLEPATIEQYEVFSQNMCYAEDIIGGFASCLWDMKTGCENIIRKTTRFLMTPPNERDKIGNIYNLAISKASYLYLGTNPDDYLIYGHTHRPFTSETHSAANTGAWVDDPNIPKEWTNTYIRIEDGDVHLRKFSGGTL